jgi:hypothetical protein
MTEDGYRRLKRFAAEAGLDEGEALSFLFENFDSVTDRDNLTHRLRLFNGTGGTKILRDASDGLRAPPAGGYLDQDEAGKSRPRPGPLLPWLCISPKRGFTLGGHRLPSLYRDSETEGRVNKSFFILAKIPHGGAGV